MAAYVIIDDQVTDDSAFRTHLDRVPAAAKVRGGRYLVRGGAHEVIRGNWTPDRLVRHALDHSPTGIAPADNIATSHRVPSLRS